MQFDSFFAEKLRGFPCQIRMCALFEIDHKARAIKIELFSNNRRNSTYYHRFIQEFFLSEYFMAFNSIINQFNRKITICLL